MKNFRKVLALVLVVATLFSFTAMAGAKTLADYTDADKITTENYEVAVEVLSALEILNGYEDDTFKPTNTITRAEMAKMIAVLANAGDDNVDKLYAAACNFADVDKVNDWFASYVSYCAYTGIVAGRSADVFDPYGKVTGLVVLEAHETVGLGNEALTDHVFLKQFLNSSGSFEVATHGADAFSAATGTTESSEGETVEVDGITGATVTSKAIARCVNSAIAYVTGADASSGATSWGG